MALAISTAATTVVPAEQSEAAPQPATKEELRLEALLAEVEQRNPRLHALRAQVRAAGERPAQVRTLEDPVLMAELWQVPWDRLSIPLMFTLRQALPWPGKLRARAAVLLPEVDRARAEAGMLAVELRRQASRAYYEYRLAVRSREVLGQLRELLRRGVEVGGELEDPKIAAWMLNPALTEAMLPTLQRVVGTEGLRLAPKVTGSEDFPVFTKEIPGVFYFLGVAPKGADLSKQAANHSPLFFADEAALPTGVRSMANLALDYLKSGGLKPASVQ